MKHEQSGTPPLRALELFCGMGGFTAAVADVDEVEVVGGIDLSPHVLEIYKHNFPSHGGRQAQLEFLKASELIAYGADMWWMSPPCQPYTTRGEQLDLEDPRAKSLVRILGLIAEQRPTYMGLENVPGFLGSQAHALVVETLKNAGYTWREQLLCPTQLGIPARRERYYLVASRVGLEEPGLVIKKPRQLANFLELEVDESLFVPEEIVETHGPGMRILDLEADPHVVANTFTGAYGKTWQAAGSYLIDQPSGRVRRFSPRELLRLLGFAEDFGFPDSTPLRHRYKAIGNSLSVYAMREVLRALPPFAR